MAQPINSWSDFRKVLRQLKDPEVQKKFSTIIIDTADIAYDYVESYICSNAGVDAIGDIPFGKGYTLAGKEFDECLRKIVQMNYGLVLISHSVDKTFTDEAGREFSQIVPTLGNKPRNIVARMADIIGYSRAVQDVDGHTSTKLFMRGTPRYVAGSRFKYTPDSIDFTYDNLVKAISDAIDKQMAEDGADLFTDKASNLYTKAAIELDFDTLMNEFNSIIVNIPGSNDKAQETPEGKTFFSYWYPRIIEIIERYAGKGAKITSLTRGQVEQLDLIITDLKELVKG